MLGNVNVFEKVSFCNKNDSVLVFKLKLRIGTFFEDNFKQN